MAQTDRVRKVEEVIAELNAINARIERLLTMVPTSDDSILAELNTLFNRQSGLLYTQTTRERGTILLEQSTGKAMSLKERYNTLLNQGKLRKRL